MFLHILSYFLSEQSPVSYSCFLGIFVSCDFHRPVGAISLHPRFLTSCLFCVDAWILVNLTLTKLVNIVIKLEKLYQLKACRNCGGCKINVLTTNKKHSSVENLARVAWYSKYHFKEAYNIYEQTSFLRTTNGFIKTVLFFLISLICKKSWNRCSTTFSSFPLCALYSGVSWYLRCTTWHEYISRQDLKTLTLQPASYHSQAVERLRFDRWKRNEVVSGNPCFSGMTAVNIKTFQSIIIIWIWVFLSTTEMFPNILSWL